MSEPALLEIEGISKFYGNIIALRDINHLGEGRRGYLRAWGQRRR